LLLGLAIKLGALSALIGPVLFVPLIQRFQIRPEEQALRLRFGETCDQYCRRVSRVMAYGAMSFFRSLMTSASAISVPQRAPASP
jgi:protein-S-isoprenylcysteine O-methyltransferase Ste14